jgi:hypothetical protein
MGSWAKSQTSYTVQIATQDTLLNAFSGRGLVSPLFILQPDRVVYQKNATTSLVLAANPKTFRIAPKDYTRRFGLDDQGVYFDGQFVPVDTTGFKVIGEHRDPEYKQPTKYYWKTQNHLFLDTQEITGVDVSSFKMLYSSADRYTLDKNQVFYLGKPLPNVSSASVIYLNEAQISDGKTIYEMGKPLLYKGEVITYINNYLGKTKSVVLNLQTLQPIPSMDAASLHPLSKSYAMDQKGIYYGLTKTKIPLTDRKHIKTWDTGNFHWIKVGATLYLGGVICEFPLDAASFGTLPHSDFFYDKKGIYYRKWDDKLKKVMHTKLPFQYRAPVNSETTYLAYASRYIGYDNQVYDILENKVYTNLSPSEIALVKTKSNNIAVLNGHFYPSKVYEYKLAEIKGKIYWGEQLTTADAASFQMDYPYYIDKNHTYVYDRVHGLQQCEERPRWQRERYQMYVTDETYVYLNNYRTLKKEGIRLLALYEGYRPGCGLDKHPSSDFYLFENKEGYWCVKVSDTVSYTFLGKTLPVHPSKKP